MWIPGMVPTAEIQDEDGKVLESLVVGDKDLEGLLSLLKEHGFTPKRAYIEMPDEPISSTDFEGHTYSLYTTTNWMDDAREFTSNLSSAGIRGKLATIRCESENDFLISWLGGLGIERPFEFWLDLTDAESEGVWKYSDGTGNCLFFSEVLDTNEQ
eukprot:TRINITY_DN398_c0_g1_i10.p1 TRINITY_DN398_c0_g1~~TRINITY_DN398_c0_g1_i10.p1  ORF type:complete len:156 (-),score=19.29 TRINITY_DN398_c0_g1_i10:528-995(-)